MKKEKGVTLISLVITIIILIILASISIKVLLGEDGLITKAKEAKKAQKISEIKERISLEITSAKAEAILRNEELEKAQVKDIIEPKYGTLKEDEDTIVTKEGNYEISLQEIYYSALSESGSYSAKVEQVEMLEENLKKLQEQYKTLKELNSGNAEELENLQEQIIELESTKKRLEQELQTAQTELENKKEELEQKISEFAKEKEDIQAELKTAQDTNTQLQTQVESLKKQVNGFSTNQVRGTGRPWSFTAQHDGVIAASLGTNEDGATAKIYIDIGGQRVINGEATYYKGSGGDRVGTWVCPFKKGQVVTVSYSGDHDDTWQTVIYNTNT